MNANIVLYLHGQVVTGSLYKLSCSTSGDSYQQHPLEYSWRYWLKPLSSQLQGWLVNSLSYTRAYSQVIRSYTLNVRVHSPWTSKHGTQGTITRPSIGRCQLNVPTHQFFVPVHPHVAWHSCWWSHARNNVSPPSKIQTAPTQQEAGLNASHASNHRSRSHQTNETPPEIKKPVEKYACRITSSNKLQVSILESTSFLKTTLVER